jgi:hypothetical protein
MPTMIVVWLEKARYLNVQRLEKKVLIRSIYKLSIHIKMCRPSEAVRRDFDF